MSIQNHLSSAIAAGLLLLTACVANATDYFIPNPLETYGLPGYASSPVLFGPSASGSSFTDIWNFSIGSGGDFSSAVAAANVSASYIENFKMELFQGANFIIDGQDSIANLPLSSGADYFIKVTGDVTGANGGTYYFFATVIPVPEPGEMALMIAGLSVLGFRFARQRKV